MINDNILLLIFYNLSKIYIYTHNYRVRSVIQYIYFNISESNNIIKL